MKNTSAKGIGSGDVDRHHQSALLASRKSGKSGKGEGEKVPSKLFLPIAIRSLSGLDLAA